MVIIGMLYFIVNNKLEEMLQSQEPALFFVPPNRGAMPGVTMNEKYQSGSTHVAIETSAAK